MERCPLALWKALKERYEQQKEIIWPSTNHEWNHLRLQDFKTIAEYNHDVHTICSKLKFCEKEPTDVEKIEKTLSTMLSEDWILHQQYCSNNFKQYSQLTHTLSQADKHHELLLKNAHQRPPGFAPLPEVPTMLIHLLGIRRIPRKIIPLRVGMENASSTTDANSSGEEKGIKAVAKHHHLATTVAMLVPSVVTTTILLRNVVAQNILYFCIKTPSRIQSPTIQDMKITSTLLRLQKWFKVLRWPFWNRRTLLVKRTPIQLEACSLFHMKKLLMTCLSSTSQRIHLVI
jgi:hypothetical protein